MAHVDTLGGMVAEIKSNGRPRLTKVGGLNANNIETENCRIYTLDGKVYEGTVQLTDASIHVNGDYQKSERTFDSVEVLLDEKVSSKEDVKALGIENGSFVCMDPGHVSQNPATSRVVSWMTSSSTAILLGFAKYVKDERPETVPQGLPAYHRLRRSRSRCLRFRSRRCGRTAVCRYGLCRRGSGMHRSSISICVKDGHGPYHYDVVKGLIQAAKDNHVDYAADVYPYYGSDADAALSAGIDARHGLIGPASPHPTVTSVPTRMQLPQRWNC